METTIPIRMRKAFVNKRVFDVVVDDNGEILKYNVKNPNGLYSIDVNDVANQIKRSLAKKIK